MKKLIILTLSLLSASCAQAMNKKVEVDECVPQMRKIIFTMIERCEQRERRTAITCMANNGSVTS
ncbi:hypothetical protein HRU45_01420 [Candidatus Dependentiae bacterium]|nr:hypothetical protein [Candidatus Dependentiae bacterium]